jgi:Ca-activated chloride channel family protein
VKKLSTILLCFLSLKAFAQTAKNSIVKGNDLYKSKDYINAAEEYKRALEAEPGNLTAKFNLANSFYKQDNKVDAAQLFTGIASSTKEKSMLNMALYNKGVILSGQKNLEASIEAYKGALRNDPTDKNARENLQKALQELKKKQPPPPKKKEDQKKKQQQQQQKQNQSKMSPKDADQRLKLLNQKEKEVQERVQKEKARMGASSTKDW